MKLSKIRTDEDIIIENVISNRVCWWICAGGMDKDEVEDLYEFYGENFKLYKLENKVVELNAREMIRCYMEKIQENIIKEANGIYDVSSYITSYITEQEYNILDYILKNLLSRVDVKGYQVRGEEVEIDI